MEDEQKNQEPAERRTVRTGAVQIASFSVGIPIEFSFDGALRQGRPGAAAGCDIVISKGRRMYPVEEPIQDHIQVRRYLMGGGHTSNTAEYEGLLIGLRIVKEHVLSTSLRYQKDGMRTPTSLTCTLTIRGDSELVIRQMQGVYQATQLKRKHDMASGLVSEIANLVDDLHVTFEHIPREKNSVADKLANEALDAKRSWTSVTSNCERDHLYGHS